MGAAAIYEVPHVFTADELEAIRYEQSADTMLFAHLAHPLQRLRRFSHNDWRWDAAPIGTAPDKPATASAVATVTFSNPADDGYTAQSYQYAVTVVSEASGRESEPRDAAAVTNDLGTRPGAPSGNFNTITWAAVTGADYYRIYKKRNGAYGYMGQVPAGTTTFIDDNIEAIFSDTPPILLNPFSGGENPLAICFHEGRLALGRTPTLPSATFLSVTDDIFNFDRRVPQLATDAISLNLRGKRINAVAHLVSLGDLLVMTNEAIVAVRSDGSFTATTITSETQGYQGVGPCRPEAVVDVLFYTTAKGAGIRTLNYTFEADGYRGSDITVFCPHLFSNYRLLAMAWAEHPSTTLWVLRDDGRLLALVWQSEQQVWGWTLCETAGFVESICVIPENNTDVLYALIRRTVGAASVRMVERLAYPLWTDENWTDLPAAVVLDSSRSYSGDPVSSVIGMGHLEGETVTALADGHVIENLTVSAGVVELGGEYSRITVGLSYEARLRTLPLVGNVQGIGSTKARRQAVSGAVVEVMNTRGAEYGCLTSLAPTIDADPLEEFFDFQTPDGAPEGYPEALFTGTYETDSFPSGDWKEALVTIRQRNPLPMVVLSVNPDTVMSGG